MGQAAKKPPAYGFASETGPLPRTPFGARRVLPLASALLLGCAIQPVTVVAAPSMRAVAWELAWGRTAAATFSPPFADPATKGHLGLYEPLSTATTLQKLLGQDTCVTFDGAGVPVERHDL